MTRLILVRHGEPVGHDDRCVGHLDTELALSAPAALRRIAQSAPFPPTLVVSSDLRRCADSARVLASSWRAELRFDPRLRELSFGDWEGRLWADIAATDRAALDAWGTDWTRFSAPQGENGRTFAARVGGAIDDLRKLIAQTHGDVAVVTHAGCIRVATTILLDEPLEAAFNRSIDYGRAAVFTIDPSNTTLDAWNIDAINDTAINDTAINDNAISVDAARPPALRSAPP